MSRAPLNKSLGVLLKLSDIAGLMRNTVPVAAFLKANEAALAERTRLLQKRGSVVPVRVDEDMDIDVSRDDIASLCRLFASGSIDEVALAYIADALQLSDRVNFLSDEIADYVAEFTDPEINGRFTRKRATELLNEIEQHT